MRTPLVGLVVAAMTLLPDLAVGAAPEARSTNATQGAWPSVSSLVSLVEQSGRKLKCTDTSNDASFGPKVSTSCTLKVRLQGNRPAYVDFTSRTATSQGLADPSTAYDFSLRAFSKPGYPYIPAVDIEISRYRAEGRYVSRSDFTCAKPFQYRQTLNVNVDGHLGDMVSVVLTPYPKAEADRDRRHYGNAATVRRFAKQQVEILHVLVHRLLAGEAIKAKCEG
jgi:hypothetical protein